MSKKTQTGFSFRSMEEGDLKEKVKKMEGYKSMVVISPGDFIMPHSYEDNHAKYQAARVEESDVWVVSYPKAGTTWTQEMVWTILFGRESERSKLNLMQRFPFFEWDSLLPNDPILMEEFKCLSDSDPCKPGVTFKIIESQLPTPRTIKSHLPMELLPQGIATKKPKILYVCRDPRDVCVSYYHHSINLDGYIGNFDDFFDLFINDSLPWSPFWANVLGFWKLRHEKNILFLRFEDLKKNLPENIRKVSKFLNVELEEEEVLKLTDHLSFSTMSKNKAANNDHIVGVSKDSERKTKFMRKGKVGDWKNYFSEEQTKAMDKWISKWLDGTDFPYYK